MCFCPLLSPQWPLVPDTHRHRLSPLALASMWTACPQPRLCTSVTKLSSYHFRVVNNDGLLPFSFHSTVWLHRISCSGSNTGVLCSLAQPWLTVGTLIISSSIREVLFRTYIIVNGFLACWRIHFGRVLTRAFIPSLWLDEGHCLYLQNDFPLFSFIPAFHPSSTPGHESENLTPRRRGRQIQEEGGGGVKTVGEMSWSISERNLRRCSLLLLPRCTWC